ncbi:MAG: hypothetical protein ACTTHG_01935 [Treponemataceae bacterium]
MTNIDKFYADIQRIKKHYRAENGYYSGMEVCKQITDLFVSYNKDLGGLPYSIGEYWISNYIEKSKDIQNEPCDQNLDWLISILCFLNGKLEATQSLPKKDWKAIQEFINYEAETLPIGVLTDLMSILVEKKAI